MPTTDDKTRIDINLRMKASSFYSTILSASQRLSCIDPIQLIINHDATIRHVAQQNAYQRVAMADAVITEHILQREKLTQRVMKAEQSLSLAIITPK